MAKAIGAHGHGLDHGRARDSCDAGQDRTIEMHSGGKDCPLLVGGDLQSANTARAVATVESESSYGGFGRHK